MPGWSIRIPGAGTSSRAVVGGQVVDAAAIDGVLTLRPAVFAEELLNIRPSDRAYVAAELTAFLLAWLFSLTCSVVNRPSSACLAGPNWHPEQWVHAAALLGIPTRTTCRTVPTLVSPDADDACAEVVVVRGRCFGCDDPALESWSQLLAGAAGLDVLAARFSRMDGAFISASPWPPLSEPAVLDAVRQCLLAPARADASHAGSGSRPATRLLQPHLSAEPAPRPVDGYAWADLRQRKMGRM
jgi:hypothetical protein